MVDWHDTVAQAIQSRDAEEPVRAMSRHFDQAALSLVNSGFN